MKSCSGEARIGLSAIIGAAVFAIIAVAIPTVTYAQLAKSSWPMFHNDIRHTGLSTVDTSGNPGHLKWAINAHIGVDVTSPAVGADGTIYVASQDRHLYALNPDGKQKWAFATRGIVSASPAIGADGTIYFGDGTSMIYALKPDGKKKWSTESSGSVIDSPAIGPDGTIYIGTISDLYALTDNGNSVSAKWIFQINGSGITSPAVGKDGTVYFGSFDDNLYAVNPDGTLKWTFATGDIIYGSPAIGADGTIYVGSEDNNVYAINPDGTEKWVFTTSFLVESSPAIGADGTIYIGSLDFHLYALTDGGQGAVTQKWAFKTDSGIGTSGPAIGADGTIYVGADDVLGSGILYAVNPDGTQKWSFTAGGRFSNASPAIGADGTIYLSGQESDLYAVGVSKRPAPAMLKINPTSLNFGTIKIGSQMGPETITLTNPKGSKVKRHLFLEIGELSGSTNPFSVTNGCFNVALRAGAECAIGITFAPTAAGLQTGTLTIFDSAEHEPLPVQLEGIGN